MVWQVLHNFDLEKGSVNLTERSPFLEMQALTETDIQANDQLTDK